MIFTDFSCDKEVFEVFHHSDDVGGALVSGDSAGSSDVVGESG